MKKNLVLFFAVVMLSACDFEMPEPGETVVAAYLTASTPENAESDYAQLPLDKLTHIFHIGVWKNKDGEILPSQEKDMPSKKLAEACAVSGTKLLLTTGKLPTDLINDPEKREKAANQLISMVEEYGYDGLDFDWEHPYDAEDREAFTHFLMTIRQKFDLLEETNNRHYQIVATLIAAKWVCHAVDAEALYEYVDFVNLMSYDLYWPNDGAPARYHAPLYAGEGYPDEGGLSDQIEYWINEMKIPRKRIVMCLPYYTYVFHNGIKPFETIPDDSDPDNYGHQNWYDPGYSGTFAKAMENGWRREFDEESCTAWYISPDNPPVYAPLPDREVTSISAAWAKDKRLLGVSAFYLQCSAVQNEQGGTDYPLLDAMRKGFLEGQVDSYQ